MMKLLSLLLFAAAASAMIIGPRHRTGRTGLRTGNRGGGRNGRHGNGRNGDNRNGNDGDNVATTSGESIILPTATSSSLSLSTSAVTTEVVITSTDAGPAPSITTVAVPAGATSAAAAADPVPPPGTAEAEADGDTLVLKEINGVPGNECLTFRNNGEIVDSACVNTDADRRVTPTTVNGVPALCVRRTFSAGFRPDLVGIHDVCVGFNGTHFRAEDCAASGIELVGFTAGELRAAGGACAGGHDEIAQVTVDPAGNTCARFIGTVVEPTDP